MDSKTLSKLINGISSDFDIVKTRIRVASGEQVAFERSQAIEFVQAIGHTITVLSAYQIITEKEVNELSEYVQAEINEVLAIVERKAKTNSDTESEVQ